jgi:hypothetical protein
MVKIIFFLHDSIKIKLHGTTGKPKEKIQTYSPLEEGLPEER